VILAFVVTVQISISTAVVYMLFHFPKDSIEFTTVLLLESFGQSLMNLALILSYLVIYLRFSSSQKRLLAKYEGVFSQQEITWVNQASREVLKFFVYICQWLMIQGTTLSIMEQIAYKSKNKNVEYSHYFWLYMVMLPSQLLLIVGINNSIKQALYYDKFEEVRRGSNSHREG
jgi:hypothetical protein